MADPATPSPRKLGAIPALVLIVVAIWEIVATRCQATGVPNDDAWRDASTYVRTAWQPGDLIVFAPPWVDPVGRLHLGDLIPVEQAARMDAARYPRIWELSIRDAHAPEVAGMTPVEERVGEVTVRRFEQKPAVMISELLSWASTVGKLDVVEVGFEPHRCMVVVVPPSRPYLDKVLADLDALPDPIAAKLVAVFSRLLPEFAMQPKGERDGKWIRVHGMEMGSVLAGGFGIADVFTRRDERRDVELRVEIDGKTALEIRAPIDRWVPFRTATTPGKHEVNIRLRWEANPGEVPGTKSVCINAEARR